MQPYGYLGSSFEETCAEVPRNELIQLTHTLSHHHWLVRLCMLVKDSIISLSY